MVSEQRAAEPDLAEPAEAAPSTVSRRVAALLPPAILLAGFGVLAVTNWSALRSATNSAQALLVVGAIVVAWVGLGILLRRFVANPWARCGVLSAVALGLVVVLVVPYFRDEKVVEQFPGVASTQARPAEPVPAPPTEPVPAPPAEPVRIASGSLSGLGHSASGTAVLYRQPDDTFVVGLEGIDIQSGPDYFVHVVPGAGRDDPDGGTDLGALRGNQGTQFYAVPAGVDPTGWTVLVWCRTFAVPVAHATPA